MLIRTWKKHVKLYTDSDLGLGLNQTLVRWGRNVILSIHPFIFYVACPLEATGEAGVIRS